MWASQSVTGATTSRAASGLCQASAGACWPYEDAGPRRAGTDPSGRTPGASCSAALILVMAGFDGGAAASGFFRLPF
jgi:hypothetical protein